MRIAQTDDMAKKWLILDAITTPRFNVAQKTEPKNGIIESVKNWARSGCSLSGLCGNADCEYHSAQKAFFAEDRGSEVKAGAVPQTLRARRPQILAGLYGW